MTDALEALTPLNVAARISHRAVGNPEAATLASGVGNCFPGLELDHRNLDRRFFPGLVFEFGNPPGGQASFSAMVVAVDLEDPLLAAPSVVAGGLPAQLAELKKEVDADGPRFWLALIEQAGATIDPVALGGMLIDSVITWRVARSLEPGPVTVVLRRFAADGSQQDEISLTGPRRDYLGPHQTLDASYRPGELTQSLCSPWQHDFRDCGCYYWSSNHPDIAIEPAPDDEQELLPPGSGWVDWLRARPDRPDAPQFGYYELNERFHELAVVLRDRETARPYRAHPAHRAEPYGSAEELVAVLRYELAPLEHVLILEYLYAWSSVRSPAEVLAIPDSELPPVLPLAFRADPDAPLEGITDRPAALTYLRRRLFRDVTFLREQLRATAISEMRHLAWVNLLLRRIADLGIGPAYEPALGLAHDVPTDPPRHVRPRALRALLGDAVADFEGVERPSGGLEGRYARVRSTLLASDYPDELFDIASRIVDDGVDHYSSFRRMAMIVAVYDQPAPPHVRPGFALAEPNDPAVAPAIEAQTRILTLLREGYAGDDDRIAEGRRVMLRELEGALDRAAAAGKGTPLFAHFEHP